VLEVSPSGFYAWCDRPPSARAVRQEELDRQVAETHAESHCIFGYRKVYEDLAARKVACGDEMVRQSMRRQGLFSRVKRAFVVTTDSQHAQPVAENVLNRDFTAERPNEKWLTDITYLPTDEGWLYWAVVLDLFSRRVVGWALDVTMETSLVVRAFEMAAQHRLPERLAEGLLHHSDRGAQYASWTYRNLLTIHAVECSMSRKGNCWDNAPIESFFGHAKTEWFNFHSLTNREQGTQLAFEYTELFYNRRRLHETLGYQTPAAFEQHYYDRITSTPPSGPGV
jgi:transposase InsO family protein